MGGAHKIAYELCRGQRRSGHDSSLAVGEKLLNDKFVFEIPNNAYRNHWTRLWRRKQAVYIKKNNKNQAKLSGWLANLGELRRWWENMQGFEDFDFPATSRLLDLPHKRPQILHAHNLHGGYFDLRQIAGLSQQMPVVITLHDEWIFTGHCSYTFGCMRWEVGCGSCPNLGTYPSLRRDGTAYNLHRKREIYSRSRLYVSASSRWLLNKAERSILKPAIIESRVIPYGIDLTVFRPGDRRAARQELGLSQQSQVVLFVANKTYSNPFKDYATVEAAAHKIADRSTSRETILLCLGEEGEEQKIGSVVFRYLGFQSDPAKVAKFYQASDIYLHASKAESYGLVIAEAQACGIPVVATAVDGIPEVFEDGSTGFLVPRADSEAMATQALRLLQDDSLRQTLGERAIALATQRFNLERYIDDYLNWYSEILEKNGPAKNFDSDPIL
jgi:glycosyltransferase involved in cell wall biosynthesis